MLVKSQVKYIQSLSQKKLRDEEGVFVAEGPKIINELLAASNIDIKQLYATESWIRDNQTLYATLDPGIIFLINDRELERISFLATPNEVLGIFKKPSFTNPITSNGGVSLLLDAIQDPGNMGTIVRCADWFGITQLICSEECADIFSTKVIQSTMGSISRVQVLYTDPEDYLKKNNGVPVYAALLEGKNLYDYPKIKEGIIVVGNESKGIRPSLISQDIHKLTIPRKGHAESLNAAVATGIILSHLT
jgi:TrmH family RNA methyltransferase